MEINKIHISEIIGGRYDSSFVIYNRKLNNYKFPVSKLGDLLLVKPQYGANEAGVDRVNEKIPRYIRITDIDEYGELNSGLGVTANSIENKYILNNDDVLIARSGNTVGKSYIHKTNSVKCNCFFAGYMIRFVVNPKFILPDYLFAITQLSFYKKWLKAIQRTTGQPNVNAEEYKSLPIPLPPIESQREIVELYHKAQNEKRVKEQQAKELLKSIDSYLLNQLGITCSEPQQHGRLIFKVNIREIIDARRLDPISYKCNIQRFGEKYDLIAIDAICLDMQSGFGAGKKDQANEDNGTIHLRPTNIDNNGNLIFEKNVYVPSGLKKQMVSKGDVLFNNTNSQELVGKTAILQDDMHLFYSNHITRIRVNEQLIVPEYLSLILNMYQRERVFYSICTNWNNQSGVGIELLKSTKIPLPPIETQNEIAKHISQIKAEAKQLQEDAASILAIAKAQIEKIILG